jgi:hypothetical protein
MEVNLGAIAFAAPADGVRLCECDDDSLVCERLKSDPVQHLLGNGQLLGSHKQVDVDIRSRLTPIIDPGRDRGTLQQNRSDPMSNERSYHLDRDHIDV